MTSCCRLYWPTHSTFFPALTHQSSSAPTFSIKPHLTVAMRPSQLAKTLSNQRTKRWVAQVKTSGLQNQRRKLFELQLHIQTTSHRPTAIPVDKVCGHSFYNPHLPSKPPPKGSCHYRIPPHLRIYPWPFDPYQTDAQLRSTLVQR